MTKHEQAFRAVYPRATVERQRGNDRRTYYLVRKTYSAGMYSGSGKTKAAAWKDAANSLPKQETNTNETKTSSSNDHED